MEDATPFAPNAEFHDAQVDVLYRNMPAGILASAVNASLLAALLWPLVPHPLLFLWCLTLWIIAGARALLIVGYRRGRPAAWTSADWHRWMLIGTTAAGVGWGSSAFFLSPAVPLSYELIQVLVLGGMTAGAASVLSVSFRLFLCYAIATTFPILGHFFLSGEEFHTLMGLMGTLFVLATTRSAWNYNRTILSSIRLRLDKAALVESLTMRTQAVEQLNREITKEVEERRLIEEQLRTIQRDLERRIEERTEALARTNIRLQEEVEEHRRTERARLSSEQRFNYLTDNLNQGVWFAQVQPPQVLYVNPAFERMWGLPADRFYQNPKLWRDCIHPDDRQAITQAYDAQIADPAGHDIQRQYRIVRPGGQVRWIHDRMVIHRRPGGEADRLSGITEDITEARELEDQLRQAQKMEAVGRLAGGVAHDFNNVMTVILGYSAVLLQELSQHSSARRFVEEIRNAGERCAALTGQLLAFSRKQMLHPVSLDLHQVIRDLMALLKSLIGEHITIVLQLDPAPRWVTVDAVQLEQVLLNLAVNARDAMPHGGTLTIETDQALPHQVWGPELPPRSASTYVRLRLHDTGTGIDPATKGKIFEPFFTTKPQGRGTGLGLSTVYGIVHQSGGTITVDSTVGEGTTMTVFLPETAPTQNALSDSAPPTDDRPGTEVILLVEDEPSVRLLTQHILRTHGYTVYEAQNGFEALDLIRRGALHVDLLLTDLVMPGMNGKDLAMRLRRHFAGLRVLYISGYSDQPAVTADKASGQTRFLQKPFSPEDLIRKVRHILQTAAEAEVTPPASPERAGR
ncbi:MAG: Sensor histidine kinase RcsC [Nitrospirae bacterium]|nr:Sensor histidine kinase RcsC [Nitrospirota bacterium]MCE7966199.1 response regulator [Nitrospira sp. NTP2]MCK6492108.1 response regulator [Nitrospira sp.]MEB2339199.1 response regulator [Nitrospirales bacterium]QOJ36094.1 MAG: response regulator [Nitrospira sp.]